MLSFFWGDPAPFVESAHDAGITVLHQVGSVKTARQAVLAGVDVIIAQGVEAGGHVVGEVSTMALVPRIVDAVAPTPVVAAGGIGDARGLVAALALGAEAVVLGTRFLATPEARAHHAYKQRIVAATEEETVRTTIFGHGWPNAPHRALRTAFVTEWASKVERGQESRPDEPVIGQASIAGNMIPLQRFMGFPPNRDACGEIEAMALLAGQSVGLVKDIKPAAEVLREIIEEAHQLIEQRLNRLL